MLCYQGYMVSFAVASNMLALGEGSRDTHVSENISSAPYPIQFRCHFMYSHLAERGSRKTLNRGIIERSFHVKKWCSTTVSCSNKLD